MMIKKFQLTADLNQDSIDNITNAWSLDENKVFHLNSNESPENVRNFYESLGKKIGKLYNLAEDVSLGDRNNQKSNKIWMEVRYDPKIQDAYRHSSNPQPMHTDGSYEMSWPNSTLMCCVANASDGGETTFLDSKEIVKILETEDKKLLEFLLTTEVLHERSGAKKNKKILEIKGDIYKVNFNYYCVSKKNSASTLNNVDKFFEFINSSQEVKKITKAIKLNSGDAVFWKDSEILHGRNGFIAHKDSDRFLWKCAINILDN